MVRTGTETISPLRFILSHLGPLKLRIASAFLWTTLFFLIPMQVPILMGAMIDGLHGRGVVLYGTIALPQDQGLVVTLLGGTFVVLAISLGITAYIRSLSVAKVGRHFIAELRKELVQKLETLSLDVHSKYGPGELLNRAILDTQVIRPLIDAVIIKNSTNLVRVSYPVVMVFLLDPFLAMLVSPLVVAQWFVTGRLRRKLHEASRQARSSIANLTTVVKEHIDGIETIQTSNAQGFSFRKISGLADRVERDQVRTQRYAGMLTGVVSLITYLGIGIVFWVGGMGVIAGTTTVGTLVAFAGLWLLMYEPLRNFYRSMNQYQAGIVAAERIKEILDLPPTVQESPDAVPLLATYGRVEFRDVAFSYPVSARAALVGLTLDIEPGTLVGIVGKSGGGKSTILKLLTRMYDPSAGQIRIDGQDIHDVTLDSLRSVIAVVPQVPLIFSGTVAENIRLAKPDASDEEIVAACRAADALDFIRRLSQGFDTVLGQGGANLSGGQIQRISIARALVRRPKILLLDEPASALDSTSEEAVMTTLRRLRDITILIVGHHLRAISMADRLVVLDEGTIVEDGVHKELLSSNGLYSALYVSAFA
jgi:ABC-type multidrug transport system fused ATPase/permease subunit